VRSHPVQLAAFIGMHIIIMPPHIVIIGMPICIMLIMFSQHFMNMSFIDGSIGIISQVMPVAVIVHFIWQPTIMGIIGIPPIGIMPPIIMGIGIICIAVFIYDLQSGREELAAPLETGDKRCRIDRQCWNVLLACFRPARWPHCKRQRRFLTI
jgi:hypothetical protein